MGLMGQLRSYILLLLYFVSGERWMFDGGIPTTLDGPFAPVSREFDKSLGLGSEDIPGSDPRLARHVTGFHPEQIHVALSTPDAMWVSWITGAAQIGQNVKPLDPRTVGSVVMFGTHSGQYTFSVSGTTQVYSQLYPFVGLDNYTSGIIHHARLTGLNPNTQYFYTVGDPSLSAMSTEHSFTTMPLPGPASYPKRIGIIGDLGLTYNSSSTIDHLKYNKPDLVLMVGDLCYADLYRTNGTGSSSYKIAFPDSPIHETYQPRWDDWGRFMEPLTASVPFMVIEGNHEIEIQAGNRTFASYKARFSVPSQESDSGTSLYYSFNAGGIHFVMLGAYVDYSTTGVQYDWLKQDLVKFNRSVTPWLVAIWHPPWYNSYNVHYREVECMRESMESLLYKFGVDVVFNGHEGEIVLSLLHRIEKIQVHAYERTNRVYNYTLDPCGPLYIAVGDGGNHEKMAKSFADQTDHCPASKGDTVGGNCAFNFTTGPAKGQFCWDRQPEWSAYRDPSFGHGIVEVVNSTHLLWTWHRNQDSYSAVGDQVYIVRQPGTCANQGSVELLDIRR